MSHQIVSIVPNFGRNNTFTPITIFGGHFETPVSVSIGSTLAETVVFVSANQITCEVPPGMSPGVYDVVVTSNGVDTTLESSFRVRLPLPVPPFDTETYAAIVARMLSVSSASWDIREGSFFRDLINAFALELSKLYANANSLIQLSFPQFAIGGYLDLVAEEHGLVRLEATKAVGQITVTGTDGTVIPIGTKFSTTIDVNSSEDAVVFVTTEEQTIAIGIAVIDVQAELGGISGNVGVDKIDQIVTGITGLLTVTNPLALTGGTDQETDDDFRERFLLFVRNPVAGGNKSDYVVWALEVVGVGAAVCIPLWNGPGTVQVLILDDNGAPADAGLITSTQNYIDPVPGEGQGKAPIGAEVTVGAPTTVIIDVTVTVVIETGADGPTVRALVEANLEAFFLGLAIGEDVLFAAVANVIYDTVGVADYNTLDVDGGTSNIVITASQKAISGTITVN